MTTTLDHIPQHTYSNDQPQRWSWRALRLPRIQRALWLPLFITVLVLIPIGILVAELLTPDIALWQQLWGTILPPMLRNTVTLTLGVGIGTLIIGTGAAWLVTAYQFPGRAWLDKLLLLPLAVPTFVMGFVFMATFDFAGPVQRAWRDVFGRAAYFPSIYEAWVVILVMTLVLYPYVYILARAAFREQAANTYEASRVMGLSRAQAFWRLVLPLARPSLAAGAVLAMMEALTDYGTVKFFSFPTLSEGIVRVWEGRFDRAGAAELAGLLLIFALAFMLLERALRGRAKFYQNGNCRGRRMERLRLNGWKKWAAPAALGLLLLIAFVLPVAQLAAWAIAEVQQKSVGALQGVFFDYVSSSVTLASIAAAGVVFLSLLVAHGVRTSSSDGRSATLPRWTARLVTLGYAMPGAMIAIGVLLVLTPVDRTLNDFAQSIGLDRPGLILTGTMMGLIYAYIVRFMSVGYNSVESSLEKVTPNMEHAARTLGARPNRVMLRIHLPLISTGIAAGAILVFVDVMKELPATLLLRPFGMDTLSIWTYFLAAEGFWQAAAVPAITILVVGLVPVFILMRVGDNTAHV